MPGHLFLVFHAAFAQCFKTEIFMKIWNNEKILGEGLLYDPFVNLLYFGAAEAKLYPFISFTF